MYRIIYLLFQILLPERLVKVLPDTEITVPKVCSLMVFKVFTLRVENFIPRPRLGHDDLTTPPYYLTMTLLGERRNLPAVQIIFPYTPNSRLHS